MRVSTLTVAVVLSVAGAAAADIVPVSQSRTLLARAAGSLGGMVSDDETMVLGLWDESLEATAPGVFTLDASASQMSTLGSSGASGRGEIFSAATGDLSSLTIAQVESKSFLRYVFEVMEPTEVVFTASASDTFAVDVFLGSSSTPGIFLAQAGIFTGTLTASFSGTLQPGEYSINGHAESLVELSTGASPFSSTSWWEFELTVVPAPASIAIGGVLLFVGSRRRRPV